MHRPITKPDFNERYAAWGGIARLAERYESEKVHLGPISAAVGVTTQTILNDLTRHLGRPPKRWRKSPAQEKFTEPQAFVSSIDLSRSSAELIAAASDDFHADRIRRSGPTRAILHRDQEDRIAQVRIVPERLPYTRVKITPTVTTFESVYVIIESAAGARCYRFRSARIQHLKTLSISNAVTPTKKHGGVRIR
ncbi:MAG: hypothetical protein MEP57_09575 [Microvirga sp.]|nr:hypothetical protein [Microvirga sp.]